MTNLILISHEFDIENEVAIVNGLFEAGMNLFHLRKPLWDVDSQRHFLEQIKPEFRANISVHQHHETVSEFGLKYFHVRGKDRSKIVLQKKDGIKYSTSFHSIEELRAESHAWDYCFFGPVFDSISKKDYKSAFPVDMAIENDSKEKIFALGGITKNNIQLVFEKGFFGAAVLGSVWNDPENAIESFGELKSLCKQNVLMY
jgi:thiamine-phosphate pyrophosphorylase